MKYIAHLFLACFVLCSAHAGEKKADLVVFSYNRPLQLYAFLESIDGWAHGVGEVHVIYRASTDAFEQGYTIVKDEFCKAHYMRQGDKPAADFKPFTLQAAFGSPNEYVFFAVDDIVVKDDLEISDYIDALEHTGAYAFYLRVGTNLNFCYSENKKQPLPIGIQNIGSDIWAWQFYKGIADWCYPHTVDMTIYRKSDIEKDFQRMPYTNPNLLEGYWGARWQSVKHRYGLCCTMTKIVNLPLNRVQEVYNNRFMDSYTAEELLTLFMQGQKMDISLLAGVDNKSAHMEYEPQFIER